MKPQRLLLNLVESVAFMIILCGGSMILSRRQLAASAPHNSVVASAAAKKHLARSCGKGKPADLHAQGCAGAGACDDAASSGGGLLPAVHEVMAQRRLACVSHAP
ncbi:MAG: hypothetical protein ACOY0T_05645 [Myxococcota bacterium]